MIKPEKYLESKSRTDILSYMPKNSICAELGVYEAKFAYWIIKNTNPKKLYLVDPYWKFCEKLSWSKISSWKVFSAAVKIIQKQNSPNKSFLLNNI